MRIRIKTIILLLIFNLHFNGADCQDTIHKKPNETNIIQGEKHIFSIETPTEWINDKALARQFGLLCFFYPVTDSVSDFKNYMYALGIDKQSPEATLSDFILRDLEKFEHQYPDYKFDTMSSGKSEGVINSIHYSFFNLDDRYKEDILYMETDSSFIVLSYTATGKNEYEMYFSAFDEFIESFKYLGSDPKFYLENKSISETE